VIDGGPYVYTLTCSDAEVEIQPSALPVTFNQ
jgi:hypothetical protein